MFLFLCVLPFNRTVIHVCVTVCTRERNTKKECSLADLSSNIQEKSCCTRRAVLLRRDNCLQGAVTGELMVSDKCGIGIRYPTWAISMHLMVVNITRLPYMGD